MNFYIALLIIIPLGKAGSWFPDLDHHWDSVKEKNSLNWIINRLLRKTGAKHRSRHTHSIDILFFMMMISVNLPIFLASKGWLSEIDAKVFSLVSFGFLSGWLSHIFSDMLTSEGVYLCFWMKRKISFVPRKIGKLRFNTGHDWENWVYRRVLKLNNILLIVAIIYPIVLGLFDNPEEQALIGFKLLVEKLKILWNQLKTYIL